MPRGYARGYPRAVTTVERAFGAQSMTAPLREVLVKRPGPAFGRAFDDPAHGFLHACNLPIAQREHDRFVELLASLGPRSTCSTPRPTARTSSTLRPAARQRSRRDPAAARQAEPPRRAGGHRGVDARPRDPDRGPDRGTGHDRGRRHVLAAAGPVVHRADPADERRRGAAARRDRRRRRARSSTSRTGAARPS